MFHVLDYFDLEFLISIGTISITVVGILSLFILIMKKNTNFKMLLEKLLISNLLFYALYFLDALLIILSNWDNDILIKFIDYSILLLYIVFLILIWKPKSKKM